MGRRHSPQLWLMIASSGQMPAQGHIKSYNVITCSIFLQAQAGLKEEQAMSSWIEVGTSMP